MSAACYVLYVNDPCPSMLVFVYLGFGYGDCVNPVRPPVAEPTVWENIGFRGLKVMVSTKVPLDPNKEC